MVLYKVYWKISTKKELKKIPKRSIVKILEAINSLRREPLPHGVKKLSASEHTYRKRIGNYRIVYNVLKHEIIIEIIIIRHRKDVYKNIYPS